MGRGRERGRSFRNWKLKIFRSGRRKTCQSSKNMHLFLLFVCLQTQLFKAELENETGWKIWCSLESGDGDDKFMGLRDFGYKDGSKPAQSELRSLLSNCYNSRNRMPGNNARPFFSLHKKSHAIRLQWTMNWIRLLWGSSSHLALSEKSTSRNDVSGVNPIWLPCN